MIAADIIGLVAFALSGVLISLYKRLDIFGVFFIASLTALGGGVIRDVLAGRVPFAFTHYYPISVVVLTVIAALVLKAHIREIDRKFLFVLFDSIGLCAFSVTGSLVGIEAGFNLFGVIILAIATAVGGGLVRDMLLNEVPFILKKEFYASVALLTAVMAFVLNALGVLNSFMLTLLFVAMLFLRLAAYKMGYQLPRI